MFVLDGVLIGAGDAVYLAWAQLGDPAAVRAGRVAARPHGLVWLWVAFAVCFMGGRAVTLLVRAHGDRWMRLGA